MTDKQDDNENIDDIDAPGETGAEQVEINDLDDVADVNDHDALAKFADESLAGGDPDDTGEEDISRAETGEIQDDDKAAADKDADDDKNKGDTDTKAADNKDEKPDEGKPDADKKPDGDATPAEVQTKDGKHTIPYAVLEDTRTRAQTAEGRAQELEQENQRLKAQIEKGGSDADSDDDVTLSEAQQAKLDAIDEQIKGVEEEYGEELTGPLKSTLEMQRDALIENARLKQQLESSRAPSKDEDDQGGDELKQIQEAIDNSSVMAAWQARNDDWWKASQEVYHRAMKNDPDFASKSLHERFQELPKRVQTAFGRDTSLPAVKAGQDADKGKETNTKPAKKDDKGDGADFKGTMSDIPGGEAPDSSPYGPIDDSTSGYGAQRIADQLADSGKLEDWINNVA